MLLFHGNIVDVGGKIICAKQILTMELILGKFE